MIRFDGADLSHHQDDAGPIDWPTLRTASWICWTKATQGLSSTDPSFAAHWAQMRKQAFPYRLAYGWLTANIDPVAQARHFLDVVGPLGAGEGAMCDAEEGGITVNQTIIWCETVEAVTKRPASIYTGAFVAGGTIWQSTAARDSKYGRRPMHLAAYTTEAKALALRGVKAYPWSAWQYSSDGPVPGVVGRCDMNRVDRRDHYDLACGITAPQTPEDDMATLIANQEERINQYGGSEAAGAMKFAYTGTQKLNLPQEIVDKVFAGQAPVLLTNAALDAIPDTNGVNAAALIALNDAVGRLGQKVGDIQAGLVRAGGG